MVDNNFAYRAPDLLDKRAQILHNFTYHAPNASQQAAYEDIRRYAKALALLILRLTPPSREQSLAFTQLEQAVMWANASIARSEGYSLASQAELDKVVNKLLAEHEERLENLPSD
jgi:hypothetical protein